MIMRFTSTVVVLLYSDQSLKERQCTARPRQKRKTTYCRLPAQNWCVSTSGFNRITEYNLVFATMLLPCGLFLLQNVLICVNLSFEASDTAAVHTCNS